MWLCGIESDGSNLLVVYENTRSLVSGPAIVGGGEHSQQVAMLLDLEAGGLALVSSDYMGQLVAGEELF